MTDPTKSPAPSKTTVKTCTHLRWCSIALCSVLAFIISSIIHPLLTLVFTRLISLYYNSHWFLYYLFVSVITGIFWFLLIRLGGFRTRDIYSISSLRYPPTWIAGIVTGVLYCIITAYLHPSLGTGLQYMELPYLLLGLLSLTAGIVGACVIYRWSGYIDDHLVQQKHTSRINASHAENSFKDKDLDHLLRWIQNEEPINDPQDDLFETKHYADRITQQLRMTPPKTVGLVGYYGCGKTSILNMVEGLLNHVKTETAERGVSICDPISMNEDRILICRIFGWGVSSNSATDFALEKALYRLSQEVDCLGLSGLPRKYRASISDLGSPWSRILFSFLNNAPDPQEVLAKMDRVLEACDFRLVIMLEDLDRNIEEASLWKMLMPLLDRLKKSKNISFVLAIGSESSPYDVMTRVFDHIETVPRLNPKYTADSFWRLRSYLLAMYSTDIWVDSEEYSDERMGWKGPGEFFEMFHLTRLTPINAISELLNTPRALKSALRRVYLTWQKLHGEIDIDELLMVNALRVGCPQAFEFLLYRMDALRSVKPEDPLKDEGKDKKPDPTRDRLENELNDLIKNHAARMAVEELLSTLIPSWGAPINRHVPLQGIANNQYTDYWVRLNAEEIPSNEIRDQRVLNLVIQWKHREGKDTTDYSLARSILSNPSFAVKLEQFDYLLDGQQVRDLAHELFELILRGEGKRGYMQNGRFEDYHPGFLNLWMLAIRKPVDNHLQWIEQELRKAIPLNLRFTCDLYYFWKCVNEEEASRRFNIDAKPVPSLQVAMLSAAKETFKDNPSALISALVTGVLDTLYRFVYYLRTPREGGEGFKPDEWKWFAPAILDAASIAPNILIPEIAGLLCKGSDSSSTREPVGINSDLLTGLFAGHIEKLKTVVDKHIDLSLFDESGQEFIRSALNLIKEYPL